MESPKIEKESHEQLLNDLNAELEDTPDPLNRDPIEEEIKEPNPKEEIEEKEQEEEEQAQDQNEEEEDHEKDLEKATQLKAEATGKFRTESYPEVIAHFNI